MNNLETIIREKAEKGLFTSADITNTSSFTGREVRNGIKVMIKKGLIMRVQQEGCGKHNWTVRWVYGPTKLTETLKKRFARAQSV